MHAFLKDSSPAGSDRRQTAFALKELVAVVAVVTLLFCVQLSAMIGSNNQTRVAQCAANLKQLTAATMNFASDNNGNTPTFTGGGNWAWDTPISIVTTLTNYGINRSAFYCPADPEQNVDGLWNYGIPVFRVIGYVLAFEGDSAVATSNWVGSIYPARTFRGFIVPASQQVMVADATISVSGTDPTQVETYKFSGIQGGYTASGWHGHRAAHLANNLPAGGNLGMIDGHVEWRSFTNMLPRTGTMIPVFWW